MWDPAACHHCPMMEWCGNIIPLSSCLLLELSAPPGSLCRVSWESLSYGDVNVQLAEAGRLHICRLRGYKRKPFNFHFRDDARLFLVVPNNRTKGCGHKQEHSEFWWGMRKNFLAVGITKHWNWLLIHVLGQSKATWVLSSVPYRRLPASAGGWMW